ncbi:hypothetical protein PHLGIDRAFT_445048 [Phlebiopsis gigantea 11061_1 CR5-6]|uniref:F-box domain-containing protein n=1 Tax=Phlebiopsis gigantea (strain 11061_1 CR5-6) TaxID=745531 RepID=A0A0C3SAA6_PHLG1|nr:hypothetical protein PHLGIDRAFT_445048 [Phlebiopsis gigantea 11061_1 CR5-6]
MDRCPVELLLEIASFACTDGGSTGCALSSVSRYIRHAVEPARYRSISLRGMKKVLHFADRLQNMDKPPKVEHLLLSVLGAPYIHCRATATLLSNMAESDKTAAVQACTTTLSQLAPTLDILFLYDESPFLLSDVAIEFPRLQDLSIPCPSTVSNFISHDIYPSLRRLHVSNIRSFDFTELWASLAYGAPSFTHLRLSGVRQDPQLPRSLKTLTGIPNGPSTDADDSETNGAQSGAETENHHGSLDEVAKITARLPNLKDVYVRPTLATAIDWTSAPRQNHAAMMKELRELADETTGRAGAGLRLHLLPESGGYTLLEARRHWQELVDGGDGPWSAPPGPSVGWADADASIAQSLARSLVIDGI